MRPHRFIFGTSHAHALRRARTEVEAETITIVNLQTNPVGTDAQALASLMARPEAGRADLIAFAIRGNFHNQIGLVTDPLPFTLDPGMTGEHFISEGMMMRLFEAKHAPFLQMAHTIAARFPGVARVVIGAPPPQGDPDHIIANPGLYRAKLAQGGVAPDALRLSLHRVQLTIQARHADALGAVFLPPPDAARDARGMLALPYCSISDPTHASTAYGRLVLDQIAALPQGVAA